MYTIYCNITIHSINQSINQKSINKNKILFYPIFTYAIFFNACRVLCHSRSEKNFGMKVMGFDAHNYCKSGSFPVSV